MAEVELNLQMLNEYSWDKGRCAKVTARLPNDRIQFD